MGRYRKRPVVIEARQVTSTNGDEIVEWADGHVSALTHPFVGGTLGLFVATLEGIMRAELGDWIIKGVKGEFYPCKPDVFDATYEPVGDDE